MKMTNSTKELVPLYMNEVFRLHGVSKYIVLIRNQSLCQNMYSLHDSLGTKLSHSVAFHLQTDGQLELSIHTLEDRLHACVLFWKGCREDHLAFSEFAYNNNYHASIKMTQ
jgi:hypothetical protein